MADKYQLELTVEPDRSAVTLRIIGNGGKVFDTRLEGPALDQLIRGLGDGRAQPIDEVAPELDEGARITNTEVDPAYIVGKNSAQAKALIALRHSGFGWLGFQFRRSAVEAIVGQLTRWLDGDIP